jgi:hypothetical protein
MSLDVHEQSRVDQLLASIRRSAKKAAEDLPHPAGAPHFVQHADGSVYTAAGTMIKPATPPPPVGT